MKVLRTFVTGLIIGLAVGMWFGMNMGKGKPILSNPFADENIPAKMKQKVGEKIEKLGGDIKGTPAKVEEAPK